jgi:hypothetical protein
MVYLQEPLILSKELQRNSRSVGFMEVFILWMLLIMALSKVKRLDSDIEKIIKTSEKLIHCPILLPQIIQIKAEKNLKSGQTHLNSQIVIRSF